MSSLVWFRNDLRMADNPALDAACRHGQVHACYVICAAQWHEHDVGDRRLAFIGRTVNELSASLAANGIQLHILDVPKFDAVPQAMLALVKKLGVRRVVANDEYPVNERQRDDAVRALLTREGFEMRTFHGSVSLPPGTVLTQKGTPYSVFSAFKRRWLERIHVSQFEPLPKPTAQGEAIEPSELERIAGVPIELLADEWPGGEAVASHRLEEFTNDVADYEGGRDHPSQSATSGLSHHLSVGTLSSNQCLFAATQCNQGRLVGGPADAWINEIIWREFYRHVTALFPHVSRGHAFLRHYDQICWRDAPSELAAWKAGETGYPFVDAGMRQLNRTGGMHNRLRMVTAMFLTKHLLIDWRHGEKYFMQQLVDGDFSSNNGGWQWSASTGTDAAPYFRVFNPATQGQRFDRQGEFVRQWLPELKDVPNKYLWKPRESGLQIGYPKPIVDHDYARKRAISTFKHYAQT